MHTEIENSIYDDVLLNNDENDDDDDDEHNKHGTHIYVIVCILYGEAK